jgi:hypothetical protein
VLITWMPVELDELLELLFAPPSPPPDEPDDPEPEPELEPEPETD